MGEVINIYMADGEFFAALNVREAGLEALRFLQP